MYEKTTNQTSEIVATLLRNFSRRFWSWNARSARTTAPARVPLVPRTRIEKHPQAILDSGPLKFMSFIAFRELNHASKLIYGKGTATIPRPDGSPCRETER
jgi:hypothetical protein